MLSRLLLGGVVVVVALSAHSLFAQCQRGGGQRGGGQQGGATQFGGMQGGAVAGQPIMQGNPFAQTQMLAQQYAAAQQQRAIQRYYADLRRDAQRRQTRQMIAARVAAEKAQKEAEEKAAPAPPSVATGPQLSTDDRRALVDLYFAAGKRAEEEGNAAAAKAYFTLADNTAANLR